MPQLKVAAAIRRAQLGAFLFPEHWHTRFSDARTNCRRGNRSFDFPKKVVASGCRLPHRHCLN
jgi:hypothetical protein